MSEPARTSITAAAIVSHVLPKLAETIDAAVDCAVGDDLAFIGDQLERLANAAESIAASLQQFSPDN